MKSFFGGIWKAIKKLIFIFGAAAFARLGWEFGGWVWRIIWLSLAAGGLSLGFGGLDAHFNP